MEYDAPFDPDEHGAEPIPEIEDLSTAEDHASFRQDDDPPNDREGMSPLVVALLILVLLLLAYGGYWWLSRGGDDQPSREDRVASQEARAQDPAGAVSEAEGRSAEPEIELPPLAVSDDFVRETAARLSEHPALVRWLARDDLVRRFVATVENVAHGASPRSHLEFMAPSEPFRARRAGGKLVADPESYARYDLLVDVFTSLDIGTAVQLFHTMEPLLDQAYREISPPGADFRDALSQAIDRLLAVDVPSQSPGLEEAVISYRYADAALEELSPAEKHLLRLGPERAARVQTKLQFLRAGLDLGPAAGEATDES
ncbi:MAG: DUF3014 domain-containing protein [Thermoanaerobaculia bacterium]|nr:DUF3014 domain-containing protein [Thermoanaerobaculia bacterium]